MRVEFNDGTYTTISRNWYGDPSQMSQHGTWTPAVGFPQSQSVYHYFAYDAYHRLCKQTSPETGQTGYDYDAADNLYRKAQGLSGPVNSCPGSFPYNTTIYHSYDARDRLININYPSGTPDSSFTWYADGKPHIATRGASTWTMNWNHRGLLKTETLAIDGHSFQLRYGYDNSGNRDSITYPSGRQVDLAPDALGRPSLLGAYAYNIYWRPSGVPASITYGNGGYFTQSRNTRNLVSGTHYRIGGVHLTDRTLTWDKNGNPVSITDAVATSSANLLQPAQPDWLSRSAFSSSPFQSGVLLINTYSAGTGDRHFYYDSLDRLSHLTADLVGDEAFVYDALGNVRSRTYAGSTRHNNYDSAHNRLSNRSDVGAFSYDDRGNVIQGGGFALNRNRANELTSDEQGTTFAYDARGWRVTRHRTIGSTHTYYYIYDSQHRLMERWDNGTVSDFVYLGKKPIARITNNKPSYIFADYQNSPMFETDNTGTVTRAPAYSAYGQPNMYGQSEIPGYTGATADKATGLIYMGARYLSAERFLSPDPAPLDPTTPFGLNRYAYANDNPVRFTDPDGRQTQGPKGYGWYAWKPTTLQTAIQWADKAVPGTAGVASTAGDIIALARSDNYNPVANKFMSPGETQTIKYGLLAFAIPGASVERVSVRSFEGVWNALPRGRQTWVRMAPSEAYLAQIYKDLTRKGSPTEWKGWEGLTPIKRPDGVEVGFRKGSRSGGSAIDIRIPDEKRRRIHVEQ